MRSYSFETYWPGDCDDSTVAGLRYDFADGVETMREAKRMLLESLARLPAGSTGICYRRYADGEMGCQRHEFLKIGEATVIETSKRPSRRHVAGG